MYDASKYSIPQHLAEGLTMYGREGVPTGSFLRFVLENDFKSAVIFADPDSLAAIKDIAYFMNWEMPQGCHGSPEIVQAWIRKHRKEH